MIALLKKCFFVLLITSCRLSQKTDTLQACVSNQSEDSGNFFFSECRRSRRKVCVANQDGCQLGSNPGQ